MESQTDTHNPFKQFCLAVYPDAEPAILRLQDCYGFDANLVLLCAWAGRFGVYLPDDSLRQMVNAVRPVQKNLIDPLRRLRRNLKANMAGLTSETIAPVRALVKQAELVAEFMVIDSLYQKLHQLPGVDARQAERAGLIRGNLLRYASLLGYAPDTLPRRDLESLITQTINFEK